MTEDDYRLFAAWLVGAPAQAVYHSHDGWWMCADGQFRKQERRWISSAELAAELAWVNIVVAE
jgi:hypothetical protein